MNIRFDIFTTPHQITTTIAKARLVVSEADRLLQSVVFPLIAVKPASQHFMASEINSFPHQHKMNMLRARIGGNLSSADALSFSYYKAAAELGDSGAVHTLASLYDVGRGVPEDFDKSRILYYRATQMGTGSSNLPFPEYKIVFRTFFNYVDGFGTLDKFGKFVNNDEPLPVRARSQSFLLTLTRVEHTLADCSHL